MATLHTKHGVVPEPVNYFHSWPDGNLQYLHVFMFMYTVVYRRSFVGSKSQSARLRLPFKWPGQTIVDMVNSCISWQLHVYLVVTRIFSGAITFSRNDIKNYQVTKRSISINSVGICSIPLLGIFWFNTVESNLFGERAYYLWRSQRCNLRSLHGMKFVPLGVCICPRYTLYGFWADIWILWIFEYLTTIIIAYVLNLRWCCFGHLGSHDFRLLYRQPFWI